MSAPMPKPTLNTASTTKLEGFLCGEGSGGELGLGTKDAIDVETPRLNSNLDAKAVGTADLATGSMHGVALTYDNKVLTWGVNDL
jgi:regulator of chromosome condensation